MNFSEEIAVTDCTSRVIMKTVLLAEKIVVPKNQKSVKNCFTSVGKRAFLSHIVYLSNYVSAERFYQNPTNSLTFILFITQ